MRWKRGDDVARRKKNAYLESEACKQLKQDMLDDLEMRGLVGRQYTDKVDEYINLWCWLQMLNEDVMARGVYLEYQNTGSGENDVAVVIALILDIGVSAVGVIGGVVNQIKVSRQKMVSCFVSTLDTW